LCDRDIDEPTPPRSIRRDAEITDLALDLPDRDQPHP